MSIDRFEKPDFEAFLRGYGYPVEAKFIQGEYTYFIHLDTQAQIKIRSSIGLSGMADGTGQDSIRSYLIDPQDNLLSLPDQKYVTRIHGWEDRLHLVVSDLMDRRQKAGDCSECGIPLKTFRSRSQKNPNRLFVKCDQCGYFRWQDSHYPTWHSEDVIATSAEVEVEEEVAGKLNDVSATIPLTEEQADELIAMFGDAEKNVLSLDGILDDDPESEIVPYADDDLMALFEEGSASKANLDFSLLSPEQAEAVNAPAEGRHRILAGPGSGKTFMLKYRYAKLIEQGVEPEKILAVTYTASMAGELLNKISEVVPCVANSEAARWITTIHAFCRRELVAYGAIRNNVDVPKGREVQRVLEDILHKVFPAEQDRPLYDETLDWIYTARAHCIPNSRLGEWLAGNMSHFYAEGLVKVANRWDEVMRTRNWIMFGDMFFMVEDMMKNDPQFLEYLRRRHTHVLLDEAQDTNHQAMRILEMLSPNFTAVGDLDQLLFRFAGASAESFLERTEDAQTYKLTVNRRSVPQIVQASRMILNNYSNHGGPYNPDWAKDLKPYRKQLSDTPAIETHRFNTPLDEAFYMAETIKNAADMTGDMEMVAESVFLLMRTRAYSVYSEHALAQFGVPFVNTTGMSFWNQYHIQQLLDYMKVLVNPKDELAWRNVYQIPSANWTVPWEVMDNYGEYLPARLLKSHFIDNFPTLQSVLEKLDFGDTYAIERLRYTRGIAGFVPGMVDMTDLYLDAAPYVSKNEPSDLVVYLIDQVFRDYVKHKYGVRSADENSGILDDYAAVVEIASLFKSNEDFLSYADMLVDQAKANASGDWSGRVVIATGHKAKGFERPWVGVLGASEGDPTETPFTSLLPHTFCFVQPPNDGKLPGVGLNRIEDERCLFYVMVTRAKNRVFICSPLSYRNCDLQPSRFVYELESQIIKVKYD